MADEEQAWYYMADGEQVGPITPEDLQQLAAAGTVHAETEVWTDGLDQWVPATHVEGLEFGQPEPEPAPQSTGRKLILGAAAQAAHPLAGEITSQRAQPVTAQPAPAAAPVAPAAPAMAQPAAAPAVAQPQVAGYQQPGVPQPGMAPGMGMQPAVPPGEEYPLTGTKRASYGLLLGCFLGGIALLIIGAVVGATSAGDGNPDTANGGGLVAAVALMGVGYLMFLMTGILTYIFIYRAWNCLRFGAPRTSAGKAVGFLFIPFFNLYWIFVALYGLAQDWNRIMGSHPNLQAAPRMSEGMFLTFLICAISGIGAPVAAVLWFIVYKQICDGVNYMAAQAMRPAGGQPGQPGGLSFY